MAQQASKPDAYTESYGNWTLRCFNQEGENTDVSSEESNCEVVQNLLKESTGQRLLMVRFIKVDTHYEMLMIAPFGLILEKGLNLIGDDESILSGPFRTCLPVGCIVRLPLTKDQVLGIKQSENLTASFTNVENHPINIKFSADGLSEALKRLE
ncbi:MAG: invasion associated locus B family protein [Pseudomonadota bacterium]